MDSCLPNSFPFLNSFGKADYLCQCYNSWPSSVVAIMKTSICKPFCAICHWSWTVTRLGLYLAFIPVFSETCSCWLRWMVRDSSLDLIFPWIKLFRLENKDIPGWWELWYPQQRHLCSFSFQPQRDFFSTDLAHHLLQNYCFVWLSFPSCSGKCTVKNHLSFLCDLKKHSLLAFSPPGFSLELRKDDGGLYQLLAPGQPALVQILENIVLRR